MAAASLWEVKSYPPEAMDKINKIVESSRGSREALDKLNSEISDTTLNPTAETIREWSRIAAGHGNFLRKYSLKFEAAVRNEESNRYMAIKLECEGSDIKFTDGTAKMDASRYIAPLRNARNLFQAYVISADNIISVCRMHLSAMQVSIANDNPSS